MFTTLSAASAMSTVMPAKQTAEPDVATARPTDSCSSMPLGELLPMSVHDKQRVVDSHRQADHRGQDRSGAGLADPCGQRQQRQDW